MVKVEYNNTVVNVPESWDDITLGAYEGFYLDRPQTARDRVELVAKVCNTDAAILLGWPAEVFNIIVDKLSFIFSDGLAVEPSAFVEIEGEKYLVPVEDELTLGAFVDADEAQKSGEAVLSNVLAIVCRPIGEDYDYKNNEKRAAMFAAQPVSKIRPVLAFFLLCSETLNKRTKAFTDLIAAADLLRPNIKILLRPGAGISLYRTSQIITYYFLAKLLNYRLRKFLRLFNSKKIKK